MTNTTVTNLPAATSLDGTEEVQIVQANTSKRTTTGDIAALNTNTGSVTSISTSAPISGGPITTSGTISLQTNGVTNAYLAQMPANTLKGNNTGATANAKDLTVNEVTALLNVAPLNSPAFTGTPTAPTPSSSDNSTQIATTAYVKAQSYGTGSVTSVTAGAGLNGGTITTSGTISLPTTGVVATTYGSISAVGQFTVDSYGRVTSATNVPITPSNIGAAYNSIEIIPGTGLTGGGDLTANRTLSLANISTNYILANMSGVTAPPTPNTISQILDQTIASAQGSFLVRGSSAWTVLSPGVPGQLLQTNGVGANPSWFTVTGAGTVTSIGAGTGLSSSSSNPITSAGTLSISNTGVTAATYGSSSAVPVIAVNAQGQITSASNTTINAVTLTTGTITTTPSNNTDIVNKAYVDAALNSVNYHAAVVYATTADLGSVTYSNGVSGVGATLTNAGTQAALVIDGHTFTATDVTNATRVLVKNESNGAYNGVYTVTNQGSGSTNWVLTRATDFDQAGSGTDEISPGDYFFVTSGSTNANTAWIQTTDFPITVGSTALVFTQVAGTGTYTAGTGLTLAGNQFSITNTTVSAGAYGSASSVPTYTVNAQGQLTAASNTSIAIAASAVTSGTLPIARGGTNTTTTPTAGAVAYGTGTAYAFTAAGTTGQVLTSNGSGAPTWAAPAATGVTSVSQTFTGGLISVSGSPITSSGTLALTVAGTSGGVPYFSSASTWATSGVLASNAIMVGGGIAGAPSTITTGTGVVTALGVNTGTSGSFVVNGGALGTPLSGTLTNATGLPISTGVSGLGTGVATALGTNVGTAGSVIVNGGALGTPSSGTLTNATGLPISTGVSGLGTGVATALGNTLNAASGLVGYSGALGTPTSGTLTNATGLPISTGVSGLGTGVATALGTNIGTAGSVVVNGGALGTPSSGTLTNATGLPLSTGVTGTLGVANGGTGASSLTANNVLLGNGTSALQVVAPGTNGNVLTSNGTTWVSSTPAASGPTKAQAIAYAMVFGF